MENIQQALSAPMPTQPSDMDFDITRTFTVLAATLIIPVYLALSVVAYSLGAVI
ncbi:MAG: hypothetical protein PHW95_04940 [Patescibacteria group bacterium]|nr:hypothetical protein [Patescibacteria group bacterium]